MASPSSLGISPGWEVISISPSCYSNDHPWLLHDSHVSAVSAGNRRDLLANNLDQGSSKQSYLQRQTGPMSARLSCILMERSKERMCRSRGEGLANHRRERLVVCSGHHWVVPGNTGRGSPGPWTGSIFIHMNSFCSISSHPFIHQTHLCLMLL